MADTIISRICLEILVKVEIRSRSFVEKIGGFAVFLILFFIYFLTVPTSLTEADSGEWTVIAKFGGIPHPSGYPLYAIILRLLYTILPPASVHLPIITSIAIFSAFCTALAGVFIFLSLEKLGVTRWSAIFSVLITFTTSVVWSDANMAEPFALNLLLAASVFYVSAMAVLIRKSGGPTLGKWPFIMGALFGLGFCNHHSLVWVSPFVLIFFDRSKCTLIKLTKIVGPFLLGFGLGLLPMFYFVFARLDVSPFDFHPIDSWQDFVRLIFRSQYGTFNLTTHQSGIFGENLAYFMVHLLPWFTWLFFFPMVYGFCDIFNKKESTLKFFSHLWLASLFLSSVVFFLMFRTSSGGIMPSVIERFMALPVIFMAWPLAESFMRIDDFLMCFKMPFKAFLGCGAGLFLHLFFQIQRADRSDDDFLESHGFAVIKIAEMSGGFIVSASDQEELTLLYNRYTLGLGSKDIKFVFLSLWGSDMHYRTRTLKRFGWPQELALNNVSPFVSWVLSRLGRVVVLDLPLPPLPKFFDYSYGLGPTTILVRSKEEMPTDEQIVDFNEFAFEHFIKIPPCEKQRRLRAWSADLLLKYKTNLLDLEQKLELNERPDLASRVQKLSQVLRDCPPRDNSSFTAWLRGAN